MAWIRGPGVTLGMCHMLIVQYLGRRSPTSLLAYFARGVAERSSYVQAGFLVVPGSNEWASSALS